MVGAFPFKSNKAARKHTAEQGRCVAHMFVMHVAEELPTWPEGAERKRIWVSLQFRCAVCLLTCLSCLCMLVSFTLPFHRQFDGTAVLSREGCGAVLP